MNFPVRWKGREVPTAWPPYFPDLMLSNFFVWGYYVKDQVFNKRVNMLDELKITDHCSNCKCFKGHVIRNMARGGL
jgi:hypothetical protein